MLIKDYISNGCFICNVSFIWRIEKKRSVVGQYNLYFFKI